MRRSRPVDTEQQLFRLTRKHELLKQQIEELDSRLYLTTTEQRDMNALKKRKLATKDAIFSLRG